MKTERLFRSGVLTVVVAIAATMFVVAPVSATPYDVWPQDKCVFEQMIPYGEGLDPYSVQLMTDLRDLIGTRSSTRLSLSTWTNANYHINGTNYQFEDVYLSNAWQVCGYWLRDVPFPTDQTLRVASGDTDRNISMTDPIRGVEFSLWRPLVDSNSVLKRNASGYYEAENGHFVFTNTSGSSPLATGPRGPAIAHSVGLIFPEEFQAGFIGHALAYAISAPAWEPCPPATYTDGNDFGDNHYPTRLPEGAVFRLKPSIWTDAVIDSQSGSGWSLAEKVMARAARDYGIYITDNTGAAHFYANNLRAYPGAEACNAYDPYVNIDGLDCTHRNKSDSSFAWIWPAGFIGPTNFEVPNRIFFPYPRDDRYADYDGDGMTNASETAFGYRNNTFYVEHNDPSNGPLDWDSDGLTNAEEIQLASHFRYFTLNPLDADSDGDGYSDYEEGLNWSADPTSSFVVPNPSWPGMPTTTNLALGKSVTAVNFTTPALAVDGNESTAAEAAENLLGSITVDLGASKAINRVVIKWLGIGHCFAVGYTVQVSPDNSSWTTVYTETEGNGGIDDLWSLSANGRYVKVDITDLGSPWGLHIYELEVYGPPATQPPVADFSGNPTSGPAPLTVMFTDLSTNDPTSWSWNFGDGGTSTAQNPSHIYTSVGSKTVSLTAANQYGSDSETKANYITVVQAQDYFCSSLTVNNGTIQSGDHTSVHASDNVYLVVRAAKSGNKYKEQVTYTYSTGLGSLSYLKFTVEGKVSAGTQPQTVYVYNYSTSTWDSKSTSTLSTTDSTVAVEVANPANYISGGTVQVRVYTGGTGSTVYDHSTDLVKITAAP
jgi:PKD repeat protein